MTPRSSSTVKQRAVTPVSAVSAADDLDSLEALDAYQKERGVARPAMA